MKKIIIAPDKFKGSLTVIEFCDAVERGIRKYIRNIELIKLPLADGGDGTVDVLNYYLDGEIISVHVNDPLMRPIAASYLFSEKNKMAFIEMAEASGIRLLNNQELNPLETSTFGTGELILDAVKRGAKHLILGIGGSSTNDAGMGMARALGYRFFDDRKTELEGKGQDLIRLHQIDNSGVFPELNEIRFEVACDVDNPLYGPKGAAFVYSPQKGASGEIVYDLDLGLRNFNRIAKNQFGKDLQNIAGAGAAGGLGAGSILFLNAELKSGINLIKSVARFEQNIQDADWIITGEGKFDHQTFSGKVIKGIFDVVTTQKLALFCGISDLKKQDLASHRIDYLTEIHTKAKDFDDSLKNAGIYLEQTAAEFAKQELMD